MERKTRFSIGYFLLVFFALLLLQNYFFMRHVQDISYSEFRKLVKEKKVDELVIPSTIIRGKMKKGTVDIISSMRGDPPFREQFGKMEEKGHRFSTVRMEDADLVKLLEDNGIQYTAQLENMWFKTLLSWILPMLIFLRIWGYFFRRMGAGAGGGLMTIGKSKARVYVEDETKVTFDDVAGVDEAEKEELCIYLT